MKKRMPSLCVITMMVLIGIFAFAPSTSPAREREPGPHENPLVINWTYSPEPGWYNENVTFEGTASNGTPPYNFSWSMGDGSHYYFNYTDGSCSFLHCYTPTESPTYYTVGMYVNDSSDPPYQKGKTAWAMIQILYDIYIGKVDTEPRHEYPDNIWVMFAIDNKCEAGNHICPGFDVELEIYTHHLLWGTRTPTGFNDTYEYRQDLDRCGNTGDLYVYVQNPGEPPEQHCYIWRAEITYAPYDSDDTWKHVDWSELFTVV